MIMPKLQAVIKIALLQGTRWSNSCKSQRKEKENRLIDLLPLCNWKGNYLVLSFTREWKKNDDNFPERFTQHFSPRLGHRLYEIAVTNTCDYIYGRDFARQRSAAQLCDPETLSDICNTNFRNISPLEKINRPCNEKSPQVKHVTKLCTAGGGVVRAGAASGNKDNERVEPLTAAGRYVVGLVGHLSRTEWNWAGAGIVGGGGGGGDCAHVMCPWSLPGGLSLSDCLPCLLPAACLHGTSILKSN